MSDARIAIHVVVGLLFLGLIAGCRGGDDRVQRMKFGGDMLNSDRVRQALVDMVQQSDNEVLKMSLPALKTDSVQRVDENRITIGRWHADMAGRTFVVSVITPPMFAEYSGVFTQEPDGRWQARITNVTRN